MIASEDANFIDARRRRMGRHPQGMGIQPANRPRQATPAYAAARPSRSSVAKNLFLSGSRTYLRKGQELVLAYMIERVMPKRRILELYLNIAEWGVGVFGAQAAARALLRHQRRPPERRPGRAAGGDAAQPRYHDTAATPLT